MLQKRIRTVVAILTIIVLASVAVSTTARAQNPQALNIGVIGAFDSPTAQGVSMAIERISAQGPINGPNGVTYAVSVIAADAQTPEEVSSAINQLQQNNVAAIFGPDDDRLAAASLPALSAAGVPVFLGTTSVAVPTNGMVFRTRAADNYQMTALTDYMLTDLAKNKVAIYQGNDAVSSGVSELVNVLTQRGKPPAPPVIQVANGAIADSARVLMESQPDAIVAFGDAVQLAELYRTLRGSNFGGLFATPITDSRSFIHAIPVALRSGIYGVTTWPYSWEDPDSSAFTRDYVALFGEVPTPLSAAAYDSAVALIFQIQAVGTAPDAVRDRILSLGKANSLQGTFNPNLGGNNLSANSVVIVTGRYGAPLTLARYDETGRLPNVIVTPTNIPPPPTATLFPTATPNGVVATVKGTLNVRSGPGTMYGIIGQLKKNDQVQVVGASADFAWFVINFRQQPGWISASLVDVFGDLRTLPIIAAPPTPTPPPFTVTPLPQPFPDIVMVSAALNPTTPQPNSPIALTVIVKNQGAADAGQFAVATSFNPGAVYSAGIVPGLPAGQQATVTLTAQLPGTGIVSDIAVVLDLNNDVNEGPNGEANNKPTIAYRVDWPRVVQASANIAPGGTLDLFGGSPDISYDGTKIAPIGSTVLGALPGVNINDVHYDMLSPDRINNTTGIARGELVPGLVVGIYTAEGKRGAMRVAGYNGDTITLEYFVYDR